MIQDISKLESHFNMFSANIVSDDPEILCVLYNSNTTGITSGGGTANHRGALDFIPIYLGFANFS